MPTQRFDGATLEEALAKVRASLGVDARITGADKLRQGGVGGFFARERVEVTVEVEDAPAAATTRPSPPAPTPLTATIATPSQAKPPASLLDLADSISDEEHDVSTEGSAFAAVLERISTQAGDAVAAQTALDPEPALQPEPQPQPQHQSEHMAPPLAVHEPLMHENLVHEPPMHEPLMREPLVHEPVVHEPLVHVSAVSAPASSQTMATRLRRPAGLPEAVRLSQLGLPGSLLPSDVSHGLHCALVEALRRLPQPPVLPTGKGTVLAVVGDRNDAVSIARDLSLDMQLDPEDVVVCASRRRGRAAHSWLELTTAEDAEEHRRSWRWRMHPTIVVIEAAIGRPRPWARDMLAALEPTAAWGVADATRKLEDVAAWSDQIGGLDALALNRTDDTMSPASILQLGVPIALVDGEPATPELWADLLIERLAA